MLSHSTLATGDSLGRSLGSSRRLSEEPPQNTNQEDSTPKGPDILADLSALQREVEAALAQQKGVS